MVERKRGRLHFRIPSAEGSWTVSDPEGLKRISEGLERRVALEQIHRVAQVALATPIETSNASASRLFVALQDIAILTSKAITRATTTPAPKGEAE